MNKPDTINLPSVLQSASRTEVSNAVSRVLRQCNPVLSYLSTRLCIEVSFYNLQKQLSGQLFWEMADS